MPPHIFRETAKEVMEMKKKILLVPLVVFLGFSSYAHGAAPLDVVRNSVNDVLDILRDPLYKDTTKNNLQRERIEAKIRDIFDFDEIARRTLATHWKKFTPEKQKEFTDVFSEFLGNIYIKRIQGYTNEKVLYLSEIMNSELIATVKTKIVTQASEIPIDYRMMKKKDGWKIYDVNIEGVSFVRNYRTQFQKILMKESPDALIQRLKQKVKHGQENELSE
jgi:phospholipid transport system substrate-binding protein